MREHAMRLIEHSVGQAKARLLFARMAFGAMGSAGAEIDLREVGQRRRGIFPRRQGEARLALGAGCGGQGNRPGAVESCLRWPPIAFRAGAF